MQNTSAKTRFSKTTIVLSVVLVLISISAVSFFAYYYRSYIYRYYINHRPYKIYGGMTNELKDSELFEDMQSGKSFCFLGDSITCGAAIKGIHWYQPLIPYIKGNISELSHSGWKVESLIDESNNIPSADIYVIAIGINDILHPNDEDAAHTPTEFTTGIEQLTDCISKRFPNSKIYLISPWPFINRDIYFVNRGDEFRSALEEWCADKNYCYINPEPVILEVIAKEGSEKYMYNDFHPNAPKGVGLFCYAVLKDAHQIKEDAV